MTGFRFASPLWFLAIIPVVWAVVSSVRREHRGAIVYSSSLLVAGLPRGWAARARAGLPWLRGLALTLIVIGLARPQLGLHEFRVRSEGIALAMCLDRSGSMLAIDFSWAGEPVNRLAAVKSVFHDFVLGNRELPGRPDDLISLIVFGGFAETRAPLTLDHDLLLARLDEVEVARPLYDDDGNLINERFLEEEQATAIGDALVLAVDRLKSSPAKSRVIVLLSDGENTAGLVEPQEAAKTAHALGIKIYAIGVGRTGAAPFPARDRRGREVIVSRHVRLDEATMRALAEATGGQYFHAEDTAALRQVYAQIDKLEKTQIEGRLYSEYRELFMWLLLPGIGLLAVEIVLRSTRFRALV